jgi:hypothetical protein
MASLARDQGLARTHHCKISVVVLTDGRLLAMPALQQPLVQGCRRKCIDCSS